MQTKTRIAAFAIALAGLAVTSSVQAAFALGGPYGYGGYGYARAYPVSAYDTGYFWGPPSRPGIYGGGF